MAGSDSQVDKAVDDATSTTKTNEEIKEDISLGEAELHHAVEANKVLGSPHQMEGIREELLCMVRGRGIKRRES